MPLALSGASPKQKPPKFHTGVPTLQAGVLPPVAVFLLRFLLLIQLLYALPEPGNCFLLVGILTALFGAGHRLPSGLIDCPHAGFHFVDILPTFAAAAEGFKEDLFRVELITLLHQTGAEVNEPIFAFVLQSVRTGASPFYRTKIYQAVLSGDTQLNCQLYG